MLIAQLTDLHLRPRGLAAYRVSETNALAERAFDKIAVLRPRPDAVLISGDLTDCGLPEEYEVLRVLLRKLDMPVFMIPGNHDRREAMRKALPEYFAHVEDPDFIQYAVDSFPIRLIGLDSVVPGASAGALCAKRLDWIEAALAREPARPTIVFVHHPPFECGIGHMDSIRLIEGAERFGDILSQNPQVERLLCGHVHRPIVTRFGGTIASIAPSVTHQVAFDFQNDAEGGLVFEPPAFELHWRRAGRSLVSHGVYVERFPGPWPFALDPAYPGAH